MTFKFRGNYKKGSLVRIVVLPQEAGVTGSRKSARKTARSIDEASSTRERLEVYLKQNKTIITIQINIRKQF